MHRRKSAIKSVAESRKKPEKPEKSLKDKKLEEKSVDPFERREKFESRKRPPGSNVIKEIKKLQNNTESLIPKACFQRVVREVCEEQFDEKFRFSSLAMEALQTSSEEYLVGLFEDSYLCTMHAKRVTLLARDMQLARRIRGVGDPGNR